MDVGAALLKKVGRLLASSDFDIAAGLREDEFNSFLKAHYDQQSRNGKPGGIYAGNGHLDDLGLAFTYTVDAPITITIAPLTAARFSKLLEAWISTVPELSALGPAPKVLPDTAKGLFHDPPPPNVQLRASKMTLTMTADDGSIRPPAVLSFSMTATGFISAATSGAEVKVTIVPIAVRLDDPGTFYAALAAILKDRGFQERAPTDPNCVPLEQLIRHIVNSVLAPRLSSFVKEFYFPVPIKLFNNVAILSVDLVVVDKLVVLLAKVGIAILSSDSTHLWEVATPKEIQAEKNHLVSQAESEFKTGAGASQKKARHTELVPSASFPNRGIFLLLTLIRK